VGNEQFSMQFTARCHLQVIWNSKMREEVLSQMETERTTASTADTVSGHPSLTEPGSAATAGSAGTTTANGFKFAALGKELVVAGVFVRVYNEQPNFPVADPAAFCKGLVTFIHSHMKPEVSPQYFCYSAVIPILVHVTTTAPLSFPPPRPLPPVGVCLCAHMCVCGDVCCVDQGLRTWKTLRLVTR